ncbi:hypothetical protein FOXYSP1_15789 [Fusarium oxysporum f. sp. phaseoli]
MLKPIGFFFFLGVAVLILPQHASMKESSSKDYDKGP